MITPKPRFHAYRPCLLGFFLLSLFFGNTGMAAAQGFDADFRTHLYALDKEVVRLEPFRATGGAIGEMDEGLVVVTPRGRIATVGWDGKVVYVPTTVPMNESGLEADGIPSDKRFNANWFRTADVITRKLSEDLVQLFVSHHYYLGSNCIELRVSSVSLVNLEGVWFPEGSWKPVYRAEPCVQMNERGKMFAGNQAGGKMLFDGPDAFLLATGDHEQDGRHGGVKAPLDPGSDLGKLLRINLSTGSSEAIVSGLRNSQGLTRSSSGEIWELEHGPQGGDELNLLVPGQNYGWPDVTYGIQYGDKPWFHNASQGRHEGYAKPVYAWVPSIATTSLAFSDSDQFPLWRGDLFVGSLRLPSLRRVRVDESRVIYVEPIDFDVPVRDIIELDDGTLAILTNDGRIVFLKKASESCNDGAPAIYKHNCVPASSKVQVAGGGGRSKSTGDGDASRSGKALFDQSCGGCHNLFESNAIGPHLVGVVGRRVGSVPDFAYSAALGSLGGRWDVETLAKYIEEPSQVVKGGTMPPPGLSASEARRVAEYLGSSGDASRVPLGSTEKSLPPSDSASTLSGPLGDPIQLFNGKDLSGWKWFQAPKKSGGSDIEVGVAAVWSVQDGILRSASAPLGYLRTESSYDKFVLVVEQRHVTKGNAGILIGIEGRDRIWPGLEFQTATGNAGDIWNHNLLKLSGDPMRAERGGRRLVKIGPHSQRPVGEWDLLEITVDGEDVTYKVNRQLQNVAEDAESLIGQIGLQVEGAEVEFRKVQLTPILSASRPVDEVLPVETDLGWVEVFGKSAKAQVLRALLSESRGESSDLLEANASASILVSDAGALIVDGDSDVQPGHQKNARWLVKPAGEQNTVTATIEFQSSDLRAETSAVEIKLKTKAGGSGCYVNFNPDGSTPRAVPGKPCLSFEVVEKEPGKGWSLVVAASTRGAPITTAEVLVIPALGRDATGQLWVVNVELVFRTTDAPR